MDYAREFIKSRLRRLVPIVLATVVAQNGCATVQPAPGVKPAQLGTPHGRNASSALANAHARLEAAATVGPGGVGGAFAALVLVALVPFAAGVGAVVGASGAKSPAEVASADSTLRAALERLDSAPAIRRQLLEVIRSSSLTRSPSR